MNLTLFMMLGYPGSGKTTFARQLAETYGMVRISSDDLRPYMYKDVAAIRDTRNNPLVFGARCRTVGRVRLQLESHE